MYKIHLLTNVYWSVPKKRFKKITTRYSYKRILSSGFHISSHTVDIEVSDVLNDQCQRVGFYDGHCLKIRRISIRQIRQGHNSNSVGVVLVVFITVKVTQLFFRVLSVIFFIILFLCLFFEAL